MNKEFMKVVVIGVLSGSFLSAQVAPSKESHQDEIAMTKCSRNDASEEGSNHYSSDEESCQSCRKQTDASYQIKHRKSAAKKVIEGD